MKSASALEIQAPPYPATGYSWYVVTVLYLAYTFSFVDRSITAYLVGPIRQDFAINDFQFSLMQGLAFAAFFTIMGIPVGRLADSWNRRLLVMIGVALWSTMTILCGTADSYLELFIWRMGVGVGKHVLPLRILNDFRLLPAGKTKSAAQHVLGRRDAGCGTRQRVRRARGPLCAFRRAAASHPSRHEAMAAFVCVGGAARNSHGRTHCNHKRAVPKGEARQGQCGSYHKAPAGNWATYLSLIGGTTFGALTNAAILGWVPAWFERRFGWNQAQIGPFLGVIIFVFGTAGLSLAGMLATRYIRAGGKAVYIKLMIAAECLVIIPLVLAHAVDEPYWVLGCVGFTVFLTGFPSGLGPAALQWITPNEMRGQVTAAYLFVLSLISMSAGPAAVGYLTSYFFADDMAVRSSAVLVGVLAAVLGTISLLVGLRAYEKTANEFLNESR